MEEMLSLISVYFSPEFIYSIPFLILVGKAVKKSTRIDDSLIPTILFILGICTSAIISLANNQPYTVFQWGSLIITTLGQGWLAGLTAVGTHQLFKQSKLFKQFSTFDGGVKDKGNEPEKVVKQRATKKKATTSKTTTKKAATSSITSKSSSTKNKSIN